MSMLHNYTAGNIAAIRRPVERRAHIQRDTFNDHTQAYQPFAPGVLWSKPSFIGGSSGIMGQDATCNNGDYEALYETAGDQGRKKLTGITYDADDVALDGASLQAIRADGTSVDGTTTSDAAGYYEIPVANPTGLYKIDAYKAGSPDVAGTTINTLTPV